MNTRVLARAALAILFPAGLLAVAGPATAGTDPTPTASPTPSLDAPTPPFDTPAPALTSPAPGTTVSTGFTGPIVIDYSAASTGYYDVTVTGPGYSESTEDYVGGPTTSSDMFPNMTAAGRYCVAVQGEESGITSDLGCFTAQPPRVSVASVSVSPTNFYPIVRDGYRDSTRLWFNVNTRAAVTLRAFNSKGSVVRTIGEGTMGRGRHVVTWNGRRGNGAAVVPGRYQLRLTANDGRTSKTVAHTVTIATQVVTRHGHKYRDGTAGRASTAGNCHVFWYQGAQLDCWGGRYAKLRYVFSLPSSAYKVHYTVWGERAGDDFCCQGTIRHTGARSSKRSFRVVEEVTGWRAYEVDEVDLNYTYRKRI